MIGQIMYIMTSIINIVWIVIMSEIIIKSLDMLNEKIDNILHEISCIRVKLMVIHDDMDRTE